MEQGLWSELMLGNSWGQIQYQQSTRRRMKEKSKWEQNSFEERNKGNRILGQSTLGLEQSLELCKGSSWALGQSTWEQHMAWALAWEVEQNMWEHMAWAWEVARNMWGRAWAWEVAHNKWERTCMALALAWALAWAQGGNRWEQALPLEQALVQDDSRRLRPWGGTHSPAEPQ
jgi:hypothetical protein